MKSLLAIITILLASCASAPVKEDTVINTMPQGAAILINGTQIGISPKTYEFDFESTPEYTIFAKKEGHFSEKRLVTAKTSLETITLNPSPIWKDTAESSATNEWLLLAVNSDITPEDIWQRMVDAVTKRFPNLEEFDYRSGYIKSGIKAKRYQTPRGEFRLRTQFVATVTKEQPLTYKIKLLSEWTDKGLQWHLYPRVFKEDSALIEEMIERFSVN